MVCHPPRIRSPGTSRLSRTHMLTSLASRQPRLRRSEPAAAHIPYIPPEIWEIVIKHACLHDHDPIHTSSELSFLESPDTQLASYRSAMRAKLSLAMVSQQWNALSRPYLYEFIWIRRAAQARLLAHTLSYPSFDQDSNGKFLRRLHIETPAFERCSPVDLRSILDHAPNLFIFSDHHSVQRNLLVDDTTDPRCSPEEILKLVVHPKIRRLSWTNYGDAPFQLRMHPLETNLTTRLEFLELSVCSPNFSTLFHGSSPHGGRINMNVCLPALRALKVSLDNDTFAALASWNMPRLTNLSVLSSDFSYTDAGFAQFFQSHGAKLRQLELGHSSSLIEEHYLTTPRSVLQMQQSHGTAQALPLADWCPALRQFICSADAAWRWQSPDWIAPHILLPRHPTVEFIGIRDIDARLLHDPDLPTDPDFYTPYFPLYEQFCSLLDSDAFPKLKFVRDLSPLSHEMRMVRPHPRVLEFWTRVVKRCRQCEIWLEDYTGMNVGLRNLKQATLSDTDSDW
ncbi:hypothetical protein WOLCODRAFT_141050 [Wolfiporia cocos MD-104 SS10]|uniref:F-box domain-containing protein n=1 Tax=Wolfiporia cocos (strain MD-104) TaxID=742152 RepID=A0A2H3JJQ2_WOLCO|nr:hypothetical protein WOLCODRAFT_141050 [Wolfiporia cocos MD-104 SS10]